jgi:glycosyltransferase involved in cell wall biosynthesis
MDFRTGKIIDHLPLVTIGVSSYNYSMYIEAALDSLLTQIYQNIELVIIDDCSSDNCPKLIRQWIDKNNLHCTFTTHKENKGITRTLNELIQLAKGKYVSLFATDDIMLPEKILSQVEILEKAGDGYGLCYAHPHHMDEEGNVYRTSCYKDVQIYEGNVLFQYINREFGFVAPTALIRRSVFDKIGYFDERVIIEDYNFFLRLVAVYKVKCSPYPCLIYRVKKDGSKIFNEWYKNNRERYYYDRVLSNAGVIKFLEEKSAKQLVVTKTNQYLKSLAATGSAYFGKAVVELLKTGFTDFSPKLITIKLKALFRKQQMDNE